MGRIMKLFNLFITSAILVSGLSAAELKRSMKVVPLSSIYLSTEYGGTLKKLNTYGIPRKLCSPIVKP